MSHSLKATLILELDGRIIDTIIKQQTVDEVQQFSHEEATGGGYVDLPVTELSTLQALLVRPNQAVTFRFDAQSDAGLEIAVDPHHGCHDRRCNSRHSE
jgi:hypothetical protein